MRMFDSLPGSAKRAAAALLPVLLLATPVLAADAAPVPDKGDTAWMMVSTLLVLLMILPGLQLFYGGLTRTKNMLSTMTQIGAATCLAMLMWVVFGYSLTFGPEAVGSLKPFIPPRRPLPLVLSSPNMSSSASR